MLFCTMSSFKSPPILAASPLATHQFDSSRQSDIDREGFPTDLLKFNSALSLQRPYPPHSPVHSTARIWKEKPKTRAATATPHRSVHKQPTRQQVQLVHAFHFILRDFLALSVDFRR